MITKSEVGSLIKLLADEGNKDKISVKLYMVEKLNNKHYYFHRPILGNEVGFNISKMLLSNIEFLINDNSLVEFNPLIKQDNTIETLKSDSVKAISVMKNDLSDHENINLDMKELKISELTFYMIEISLGTNNIKLLRRYTNAKTLRKRSWPLKFLDNSLHRMLEELFFIDDIVDIAIFNEKDILIFNRYSFEIIMNYKDNYLDNLRSALNSIKTSKLIENFEQFEQDCFEQITVAKKFTNIMKNNNINIILKNINKVESTILELELPIEFKNRKIIYADKSQLYVIIEILSDNFARTLIGNQKVNVPIKNVI